MKSPHWKTISQTQILSCGKWLSVDDCTVETPDGQRIDHWLWIKTPDYINVIAVNCEGQFLVLYQGKYGLERESLAPVGGYIEPGEEPLEAARRELLEEIGYKATEWIPLGSYIVDPNRGVAQGYLYLARGAYQVAEPKADDLEKQKLVCLSRAELETALREGQFQVLAWAANVAFALMVA
jgi:ADP-ribose pyrophosphatase